MRLSVVRGTAAIIGVISTLIASRPVVAQHEGEPEVIEAEERVQGDGIVRCGIVNGTVSMVTTTSTVDIVHLFLGANGDVEILWDGPGSTPERISNILARRDDKHVERMWAPPGMGPRTRTISIRVTERVSAPTATPVRRRWPRPPPFVPRVWIRLLDQNYAAIPVVCGTVAPTSPARLASDLRVEQARASLLALLPQLQPVSLGPIRARIDELARIVSEDDRDGRWRTLLVEDAARLVRDIGRGLVPFEKPRGYVRMGHVSRLDDHAPLYELLVPAGYRHSAATGIAGPTPATTREWPLLVTLHGFAGNAGDYFRNTLGSPRVGETLLGHGRYGPVPTTAPFFVVAPTGRGQAMYRYAGEEDVLEVIADVRARFRIDPRRIYVTGGSMGGTGAAWLPFRYPGLFAASAALAGYHDQRVRQDTNHALLTPWERALEAERSDVDWAENALHLPMLLVRGTQDRPIEWTRSLATRLGALGYRYEHREPNLGHNVWTETYADGAIFRWFAPHRTTQSVERVRFRTARDRHHRAYWVDVLERSSPDGFADIDATWDRAATVSVAISGATRLGLDRPSTDANVTRVVINQEAILTSLPAAFELAAGHWVVSSRTAPARFIGPIRDAYHDPLLFVYGTQDARFTILNKVVARSWARPKGWVVHYPIIADTELTSEMASGKTLVLIGPPWSNSALERIAHLLPMKILPDGIGMAPDTFIAATPEFENLGAAFIARNPEALESRVVVIAGLTPLAMWQALSLPDLLPDWVVFDRRIARARGAFTAGGSAASFVATGYWPSRTDERP